MFNGIQEGDPTLISISLSILSSGLDSCIGNHMVDGHTICMLDGLGVLVRFYMLKLGSVEGGVEDNSRFLYSFGTPKSFLVSIILDGRCM